MWRDLSLKDSEVSVFSRVAVLSVLNKDVEKTDALRRVVGYLFADLVRPWLSHPHPRLLEEAILFVAGWLPPSGLGKRRAEHALRGFRGFCALLDRDAPRPAGYPAEEERLVAEVEDERKRWARLALKRDELLEVPGTSVELGVLAKGLLGSAGETDLASTAEVRIELDLPRTAKVILRRLVPHLDGVPEGATTIAPIIKVKKNQTLVIPTRLSHPNLPWGELPKGYIFHIPPEEAGMALLSSSGSPESTSPAIPRRGPGGGGGDGIVGGSGSGSDGSGGGKNHYFFISNSKSICYHRSPKAMNDLTSHPFVTPQRHQGREPWRGMLGAAS